MRGPRFRRVKSHPNRGCVPPCENRISHLPFIPGSSSHRHQRGGALRHGDGTKEAFWGILPQPPCRFGFVRRCAPRQRPWLPGAECPSAVPLVLNWGIPPQPPCRVKHARWLRSALRPSHSCGLVVATAFLEDFQGLFEGLDRGDAVAPFFPAERDDHSPRVDRQRFGER